MENKKMVENKKVIDAKELADAKKKVASKKKAAAKRKANAKKKADAKKLVDAKKIDDDKKEAEAIKKADEKKEAERKFTDKIKSTKVSKHKRDMDELISVINLTSDSLIYVSKSQLGYEVEWDGHLAENHMEYRELVNMRNSQVAFFKNTWVLCDQDVLEDLKIERFYKDLFELDDMDILLSKPHNELGKILEKIALSTKRLIADYAFKLKKEGNVLLDSTSLVKLIEEKLDIDLTL